jgi:HEAT repeat protein
MTCDEAKVFLSSYWSQSLSESEELAFEGHLGVCDACHAESERLGTLWRGLGLLPVEEPSANLRTRFYESLSAYRQGLEAAPKQTGWRLKLAALWPRQPAMQMGLSFAMLVIGVSVGYGLRSGEKKDVPGKEGSEVAQLRGEVSGMRQLVALSLMQQQSASERIRGVSYANRVESSDTEVLAALLSTVNSDPIPNVRMAAVDALRAFGSSPVARTAVIQSIPRQTSPIVQVALIDLLVDLKEKEAVPELRKLTGDKSANEGVRQRAQMAIERLQ